MRSVRVVLCCLALLGLTACREGDPSSTKSCSPSGAAGEVAVVALDRATVRVAPSGASYVTVRIDRGCGLDGDATVSLEGSLDEAGVRATPLVIASDADVGLLELHATTSQTAKVAASVVVRVGDFVASAPLTLDHTSAPYTPDARFGTEGEVLAHTDIGENGSVEVETMTDGRLVVAGSRADGVVFVQRLLPDGSPDTSLAGTGETTRNVGSGTLQVNTLALHDDGRIVIGGYAGTTGFVARFLADGTPDTGFGMAGVVTDSEGEVQRIEVRADGRLLVLDHDGVDCHLRGLDASGGADPAFASGAVVTIDRTPTDFCESFVRRPDGSIVVLGSDAVTQGFAFAFDAAGAPIASFGTGGSCALTIEGEAALPTAGLVLGAAGFAAGGATAVSGATLVAAFDEACAASPTFGDGGAWWIDGRLAGLASDGRRLYAVTDGSDKVRACVAFVDGIPDGVGANGCATALTVGNGIAHASDFALTPDGDLRVGGGVSRPWLGAGLDSYVLGVVGGAY